jgi:hypothetical protein
MKTTQPISRRAKRVGAVAVLTVSFMVLTACAHQDLTAPCTRDGWLSLGTAYASDCGALRPVNPDGVGQGAVTP